MLKKWSNTFYLDILIDLMDYIIWKRKYTHFIFHKRRQVTVIQILNEIKQWYEIFLNAILYFGRNKCS